MKCHQCQQENPEGQAFCGHCGARLSASNAVSDTPESTLGIDTKSIVEETVKDIKKEARIVEVEAVEAIQEKAIKWAKLQIVFPGVAIAILQISLIVWGVKEFSDIRKEIDKVHTEIVKKMEEFDKSRDEAIKKANETSRVSDSLTTYINKERASLYILHDSIKKMEGNAKSEVENMKNELTNSVEKARLLITNFNKEFQNNIGEARSVKNQAEKNKQAIDKLQNSFFDIFVHFEGNTEQKSKILPDIIARLNNEGFLVSGRNIAQVGVNITEILYYDPSAEAKVLFLKQLLKEWYKYNDIQTRLIPKDDRNPREILVKLRIP